MRELFPEESWQRIRETYEAWWAHKLDRPVIHLSFSGVEPQMEKSELPLTDLLSAYNDEPVEKIVYMLEYQMRSKKYALDGYPYIFLYFGPMHPAEYFGAKAVIKSGTVWYDPPKDITIPDFHMELSENSVFARRIPEVMKAIDDHFTCGYVGGSPMGGGSSLDIVAEYFDAVDLLTAFYDYPEDVKRLTLEAHQVTTAFEEGNRQYCKNAKGYARWGGIYAPEPWIGNQCDIAAMFGPDSFREFSLWDLKMAYDKSPKYNYYHLDGPQQIAHLPLLLELENLQCIQYEPAPGEKHLDRVKDVYKPILDAGKNVWYTGKPEDLEALADALGTLKGIYIPVFSHIDDYDRVMKLVEPFI